MKLIIKRSEWMRGERQWSSLRREEDGKKCCLGIFLEQLGIPLDCMTNIPLPASLFEDYPEVLKAHPDLEIPEWLFSESQCQELSEVNDDKLDEADREEIIKKRFADHDVEVTFED